MFGSKNGVLLPNTLITIARRDLMQFSIRSNSIYVRDFEIKYSDIISKLSLHNNDIAYISGSLVEGVLDEFGKGMGNQYSDIDVFIIREHSLFVETESIYCDQYKKQHLLTIHSLHLMWK